MIHDGAFDKNPQLIRGNKVKCKFILALDSDAVKDVAAGMKLDRICGRVLLEELTQESFRSEDEIDDLFFSDTVYPCVKHILLDVNQPIEQTGHFVKLYLLTLLSFLLLLLFYSYQRQVLPCFGNAKRCLFLNTGAFTHTHPTRLHSGLRRKKCSQESTVFTQ